MGNRSHIGENVRAGRFGGAPTGGCLVLASALMITISSEFDGGNIEVKSCGEDGTARLAIRPDKDSDHFQWFYFRVTGGGGLPLSLAIENAGEGSYPPGWEDYDVAYSYDRDTWFRTETAFEDGVLTINHQPEFDSVYYAYFAPYSMERHHDLVAACITDPRVAYERLGGTVDGQDMDMLTVGSASEDKLPCWIIARQHPGETMAEWLMEGLLERLLDPDDPVSRALLERAVFYVVPNMNPDGSRRGHLRTTALGVNLNRVWDDPNMQTCPEVAVVRQRMEDTNVAFFLDVHGDEALPYNFIAGPDGVEGLGAHVKDDIDAYQAALVRASPDFQTEFGYPVPPMGEADMSMATNWVAKRFNAISMTLEQPFKDTKDSPSEIYGWSPARARHLGRANLDALHAVIARLKVRS